MKALRPRTRRQWERGGGAGGDAVSACFNAYIYMALASKAAARGADSERRTAEWCPRVCIDVVFTSSFAHNKSNLGRN